jgi:hypothetical protein
VVCGLESTRQEKTEGIQHRARGARLPGNHARQGEKRGKTASESGRVAHALAPYIAKWQQKQHRSLGRNYLWAARSLVGVAGRVAVGNLAPIDLFQTVATWDHLAHATRYARSSALGYVVRLLETAHGAPKGLSKTIPKIGKPSPRNTTATLAERAAIMTASPVHLRLLLLMCSDLAIRSGTALKMSPGTLRPEREAARVAASRSGRSTGGRKHCQ